MGFTNYHFTHTHVIIRKLKHLKNKINYIISIINHIFGSGYHKTSLPRQDNFVKNMFESCGKYLGHHLVSHIAKTN